MIRDHVIRKPASMKGYELHRMVAELCSGERYQFVDRGDHLIVRTSREISDSGSPLKATGSGDLLAFELRACVATRLGGKNIYPDVGDWRSRRSWLEREADRAGFLLMAVHVTDRRLKVVSKSERSFWIDATDFTGILKVVDQQRFSSALAQGIGRVGKAFGMGMLII